MRRTDQAAVPVRELLRRSIKAHQASYGSRYAQMCGLIMDNLDVANAGLLVRQWAGTHYVVSQALTALTYAALISESRKRDIRLEGVALIIIGLTALRVWSAVFEDGILAISCATFLALFTEDSTQYTRDASALLDFSGHFNSVQSFTDNQVISKLKATLWQVVSWWESRVTKRGNELAHRILIAVILALHLRRYMYAYAVHGPDAIASILIAVIGLTLRVMQTGFTGQFTRRGQKQDWHLNAAVLRELFDPQRKQALTPDDRKRIALSLVYDLFTG